MNQPAADVLASLAEHIDEAVEGLFAGGSMSFDSDADLVRALSLAGRIMRRVECVVIETVGAVAERSETAVLDERLTSRFGCHNVSELVQRTTLAGPQTAGRWQRAARSVRQETSIVTGECMGAPFPAMREALLGGDVGVDGLLAVATPLSEIERRVGREVVLLAEAELAAAARGEGVDAAPPACADLLRVQAVVWATVLDPDGSEPREAEALHGRGFTFGTPRRGVVPFHGNMLPEVAAQLQRIIDAVDSPRGRDDTGGVRFRPDSEQDGEPDSDSDVDTDAGERIPLDDRRPAQRRHDALATALFAAATSGTLPTIGGAAPVLVVSARESDVLDGKGWAHAEGTEEPLPIGAAHRVGCAGIVQKIVLSDQGRILRIGTEERVFNRHQRRGIALRDGGCIIPGCNVPAAWCEIHHAVEHQNGGPTHTDNGVLLCWYHHRFIDWHGWKIRMNNGVPEVQAPPWNDPTGRWRPITKSKIRLTDLLVRRT